MFKEIEEYIPKNVEIPSDLSTITSSFNNIIISGSSNNSTYNITNIYSDGQPRNIKNNDLIIIENQEHEKEVFLNDKRIFKIIWKYLDITDKFNCTMVCKRFNSIISGLDFFRLIVTSPSMTQVVPSLSRYINYKTVIFRRYQCKSLKPPIRRMLKHLSRTVIDLTLHHCQLDLMTLCDLLIELPLLESIVLQVVQEMENNVELSLEDLPKLMHIKSLTIDLLRNKMNGALDIFGASIIESLTLFRVKVRMTELSSFLDQHKNSLKSLTLGCAAIPRIPTTNLHRTISAALIAYISCVNCI